MLKFYIYVSKTKVDMLYPQIPAKFLSAADAELKVNLGVVSAGLKSKSPDRPTELTGRVASLVSYIRENETVGTVDDPCTWIQGTADLHWGIVEEYASDIALFGGSINSKVLALLGARESIVGAAQTSQAQHDPYYYTLKFFNSVVEGQTSLLAQMPPYTASWEEAVTIGLRALPKTTQRLDFMAKVLLSEENVLVATPLYVALA
jgi:hypothetical protein